MSSAGALPKKMTIGIVMPTFTAAAYTNSFYVFYSIYHVTGSAPKNVTTNLNLLSSNVSNHIGTSLHDFQKGDAVTNQTSRLYFLFNHLKGLLPLAKIETLTDPDVDNASIFLRNGTNKYDILIIGHQEYVTQNEYDNLRQFVANGGTMIVLDGNVFYAQVNYDRNSHTIRLVNGHSWAFNGKSAWRSVNERWSNETSEWLGSNSYNGKLTYTNDPFKYPDFEEQYITNPNAKIIMNYGATVQPVKGVNGIAPFSFLPPGPVIATYEMNYQKGKVIVYGIYADRVISSNSFLKFFDRVLLEHTLIGSKNTPVVTS